MGYDVLSYNVDGSPRHVDVKTTSGHAESDFYISASEVGVRRGNRETSYLYVACAIMTTLLGSPALVKLGASAAFSVRRSLIVTLSKRVGLPDIFTRTC